MAVAYSLEELARQTGGQVQGDPRRIVRGVATLDRAGPDDLSFLTNLKYRQAADSTRAGALLVARGSGLKGHDLLEVDEPYLALARLLELFFPVERKPPAISDRAQIGADVSLGEGVSIEPFAVIEDRVVLGNRARVGSGCIVGEGSSIGEDTELRPNVVLYPGTSIGQRCLVHSGVILGSDGYGFATSSGKHNKIPQVGRVVVEDDVEIGANTTVDRGALGDTSIGEGSKLDNLVMIAHGVKLGRNSLLAAQAGIAGSTTIGDGTTWAGQSGAAGHLQVAAGTVVGAKSAVLQDIPDRAFVAGIPAVDHRRWKRAQAGLNQLDRMRRQLRELKSRLAELERRLDEED